MLMVDTVNINTFNSHIKSDGHRLTIRSGVISLDQNKTKL